MKNTLPWILLFVVSLVSLFLLLNAGSELGDARTQTGWMKERANLTLRILQPSWIGRDQGEAIKLANELDKEGEVKGTPKENAIQIGDIVFEFKDGKVNSVHYRD